MAGSCAATSTWSAVVTNTGHAASSPATAATLCEIEAIELVSVSRGSSASQAVSSRAVSAAGSCASTSTRAIDGLDASPDTARRLLDLARAGCDTRMDTARVAEVARLAFHMAVRVDDRPLALEAEAFRLELLRA